MNKLRHALSWVPYCYALLFLAAAAPARAEIPAPGPLDQTGGERVTQIQFTSLSGILNTIWSHLFQVVFLVLSMLAVLSVVWAGIQYLTAGGDTKKVTQARTAIFHSVLALILIITSYSIITILAAFLTNVAERVD